MKKHILVALAVLTAAVIAYASAPTKGSIHAASGTSNFERNFVDRVSNLSVAPATADVKVIHYPHFANQDTFTVRSGDVMTWVDLNPEIWGFKVIRSSATVVDVYWW